MKFSEILGHEDVKRRLREMVDADRLPHALLLQGPSGIGKMMLARATAQYLHCANRHDGEPCGKCPACLQHQSFNHIDTIFSFPYLKKKSGSQNQPADDFLPEWREYLGEYPYMDFEQWQRALGNPDGKPVIYVDESVSLIHKLNFTTHNSRYKVAIIWLPERMNAETANKLLKIIEEPYPDTKLIFVSNRPDEILPTIYSRCQRIDVKRLSETEIAHYLMTNHSLAEADALTVAHIADGSVNEAIKQVSLTEEHTEFLELFKQLMRDAYTRDVRALRLWSEKVHELKRERVTRFLAYCSRLIRENFIYNLNLPTLSYMNRHEADFSVKFARFINERNVVEMVNEFDEAIRDVTGNVTSRIVLFDLAIRMIILIKA